MKKEHLKKIYVTCGSIGLGLVASFFFFKEDYGNISKHEWVAIISLALISLSVILEGTFLKTRT